MALQSRIQPACLSNSSCNRPLLPIQLGAICHARNWAKGQHPYQSNQPMGAAGGRVRALGNGLCKEAGCRRTQDQPISCRSSGHSSHSCPICRYKGSSSSRTTCSNRRSLGLALRWALSCLRETYAPTELR